MGTSTRVGSSASSPEARVKSLINWLRCERERQGRGNAGSPYSLGAHDRRQWAQPCQSPQNHASRKAAYPPKCSCRSSSSLGNGRPGARSPCTPATLTARLQPWSGVIHICIQHVSNKFCLFPSPGHGRVSCKDDCLSLNTRVPGLSVHAGALPIRTASTYVNPYAQKQQGLQAHHGPSELCFLMASSHLVGSTRECPFGCALFGGGSRAEAAAANASARLFTKLAFFSV